MYLIERKLPQLVQADGRIKKQDSPPVHSASRIKRKPHNPFMPSAARKCGVSRHQRRPLDTITDAPLGTDPSIQRLRRHSGRTDGGKDSPMSSAKSAMYRIERKTPQPVHAECCRSDEHTSELQPLMRITYAVF